MKHQDIESLLRQAPRPVPPASLQPALLRDIPQRLKSPPPCPTGYGDVPFWRRWVPALSFGALLATGFVVLAVQTTQLMELRQEKLKLSIAAAELSELRAGNAELRAGQREVALRDRAMRERAEFHHLQTEVETLSKQLKELPSLQAQVEKGRKELVAARNKNSGPPAVDPFAQARGKSEAITCVSNMKQIGLAARVWAKKNHDVLPSTFEALMTKLSSPKILICPSDPRRQADSSHGVSAADVTYELVTPGVEETDPSVVFARCPIHGHVGLADGSVHQVGLQSDLVRVVDGKTRLVKPSSR